MNMTHAEMFMELTARFLGNSAMRATHISGLAVIHKPIKFSELWIFGDNSWVLWERGDNGLGDDWEYGNNEDLLSRAILKHYV